MGLLRRKSQPGIDWQTFALMSAQGHELEECDRLGISGTEADQRASAVSRAVLQEHRH